VKMQQQQQQQLMQMQQEASQIEFWSEQEHQLFLAGIASQNWQQVPRMPQRLPEAAP
jgi:hypothetical protein